MLNLVNSASSPIRSFYQILIYLNCSLQLSCLEFLDKVVFISLTPLMQAFLTNLNPFHAFKCRLQVFSPRIFLWRPVFNDPLLARNFVIKHYSTYFFSFSLFCPFHSSIFSCTLINLFEFFLLIPSFCDQFHRWRVLLLEFFVPTFCQNHDIVCSKFLPGCPFFGLLFSNIKDNLHGRLSICSFLLL